MCAVAYTSKSVSMIQCTRVICSILLSHSQSLFSLYRREYPCMIYESRSLAYVTRTVSTPASCTRLKRTKAQRDASCDSLSRKVARRNSLFPGSRRRSHRSPLRRSLGLFHVGRIFIVLRRTAFSPTFGFTCSSRGPLYRGSASRSRPRPKSPDGGRAVAHVEFGLRKLGGHGSFLHRAHWVSRQKSVRHTRNSLTVTARDRRP